MIKKEMQVTFINRSRLQGHYSLEGYFQRIASELNAGGISVISRTSPFPSKGIVSRLRTIRFAHKNQSDINHITGDIHFAALGTNPSRTVITVADCGRLHQVTGLKRELLRQIWFQQPLKKVAAITVISKAVKDDLLSWVPDLEPEKIHIVPVSISPCFKFSPKPFCRFNPRILQVGTTPNKNLPRLVEALKGLDITLVVVGKLDQYLHDLLVKSKVHFENYHNLSEEGIVDIYRSVDLVSFVSTLEGFGMPILEAQAIGRPVLTSSCSSMPEVAGKGALYVDPTSVKCIRAGLLRLVEDGALRTHLISCGIQNVHRFSTSSIAAQYGRIYRLVLDELI